MSPKEIHLEFMKAALTGITSNPALMASNRDAALTARHVADVALIKYQQRWEGEKGI